MNSDKKELKAFFDQWTIYQKFLIYNYMEHQEFYQKISEQFTLSFPTGFSLLDLGSGDSSFSAKALNQLPIQHYVAIELSDIAIRLAKDNMKNIMCPQRYILGDFVYDLHRIKEKFDIILCGYALHHLSTSEKQTFFTQCRHLLNPNGILLILDIVLKEDESLHAFYKRWTTQVEEQCPKLTGFEKQEAIQHVTTKDFPETLNTLQIMAKNSGFTQVDSIVRGNRNFYELVLFKTAPQ
jgi:tRNA (cmo5U34)-methyltransferase